ncbi:MAG: proline--tRNA ligase, partial [Spirochaetae bacterium HGW-Spirochaetae-10]
VAPAPNGDFDEIGSVAGFAGALNLKKEIRVLFDRSCATRSSWVTGANEVDHHLEGFHPVLVDEKWKDKLVDLSLAVAGDPSPDGDGKLREVKGIEVGHIFKLGDKYTKAMNLTVLNDKQKPVHPLMGCYGIGLNRTMATVIEQNFDEKGIIWPISVAPFEFLLVDICKTDEEKSRVRELYRILRAEFDILWDDRDLRPGVKFNDAELIGFPVRITAGKTFFETGKLEVVIRQDNEKLEIDASVLVMELRKIREELYGRLPALPESPYEER